MLVGWGVDEYIQDFDGKTLGKHPLARYRMRWEDHIKHTRRERDYENRMCSALHIRVLQLKYWNVRDFVRDAPAWW
jgi:hypothetical protein